MLCSGCSSLKEYWTENYGIASAGAIASQPEINDGKIDTYAVTKYPNREYEITLPEEREINRVIIYSVNLKVYDLLCLDMKTNKWTTVGQFGAKTNRKGVYSDQYKTIPRYEHRINFKTNKIKLLVIRTVGDGVVTTRTPEKSERIIEQKSDYIQMGRERKRIDLYEVFRFTDAGVREIEVYSHLDKPETK